MKIYKISQDYLYSVETATNTIDPETLRSILKEGNNDWVSAYAAENPNCPPDALAMVLSRGENDEVSYQASKNLNCPPEAKIKWMMQTGKIEQEDPNKHFIQKDIQEQPEKDNTLENLKKLLGNSKFNLKQHKLSQNESWYNEETAKNTKDLLKDI